MIIPCIDFDVHPMTRNGLADVKPFLSRSWRHRIDMYPGLPMARRPSPIADASKGANFASDAWGPDGSRPGSDPQFVREHLLDRQHISYAILAPFEALYLSWISAIDDTSALAQAFNDYFISTWLPVDPRYRLAIGVSAHDPLAAAAEIRRLAKVPGVNAVLLPLIDRLMGHRHYNPIYEAAEEAGLPIISHIGSGEGDIQGAPTFPVATPGNYIQLHTMWPTIAMANVVSLVLEGTFQRFPRLTVVFAESGFSWLPHVMWRMDHNWRSLHDETPWLTELPSHYVRKHIRCTTQPIDEPHRKEHLAAIVEMAYGDETLLFSSDYPHWDNEFPSNALDGLSESVQRRILYQNAVELLPELHIPEASEVGAELIR